MHACNSRDEFAWHYTRGSSSDVNGPPADQAGGGIRAAKTPQGVNQFVRQVCVRNCTMPGRDNSPMTSLAACPAGGGCWNETRKLGTICALLAATPWLLGCETSRGDRPNPQFQKQVQRAQECRQLQAKLVGDQPLTPERAAEITKTMN